MLKIEHPSPFRGALVRFADYGKFFDLKSGGYEKWLMVVDESGRVVDITKLDAKANAIGKVPY